MCKKENRRQVAGDFSLIRLALVAVDPRPCRLSHVNLARTVNLALRIVVHFLPVGNPAGETSDGEHHGKHVRRDAHGAVENARVEVHVRVELALDEVVVLEGGFFELDGYIQELVVHVFAFEHLVHELLQHLGARVVALVHAVAKAGKTERVALVFRLVHHLLDGHAALLDAQQRFEHSLVCTAVERAPQGADAGADARVKVRLRATHHTHCRCGAVLLVVGMHDEERVERLFHNRIRVVRASLAAEHHVEEVAAVAAFRFRVHERFADACLVGESGDGADLGNKARSRELESACNVFVVVEARGEQAHGVHDGTQNAHRVRARRHLAEKVQQVLVQESVFGKERTEASELFRSRELTVNQEPGGLGEGRLFGQVFDGVTSVAENALLAVHVGDGALGAARVQVAVVKRDKSRFLAEGTDVETMFVLGAFNDGELETLSVVFQGRFVGHLYSLGVRI